MNRNVSNFAIFLTQGEQFFKQLVSEGISNGLPLNHMTADHLCFRVETEQEYFEYKQMLLRNSKLITESEINGRPICTFHIEQGFHIDNHHIYLIELPAPKQNTNYKTGFEHAEFIIKKSIQSFQQEYPHLQFKLSGQQVINPELGLQLKTGQIKFHYIPLDRVIEIEEAQITDVIFDFDGTLLHSREDIYEINRRVFSHITGRKISLEESIHKFHSDFQKLFSAYEITEHSQQIAAIKLWSKIASEFDHPLFDNVENILKSLQDKQIRLHLWTARDLESTMKHLKTHNMFQFFNSIHCCDYESTKPNPLNFKSIDLINPRNSILIGDSITDIQGAKNLNIFSAGATWDPHSCKNTLIHAGADMLFSEISDLLKIV